MADIRSLVKWIGRAACTYAIICFLFTVYVFSQFYSDEPEFKKCLQDREPECNLDFGILNQLNQAGLGTFKEYEGLSKGLEKDYLSFVRAAKQLEHCACGSSSSPYLTNIAAASQGGRIFLIGDAHNTFNSPGTKCESLVENTDCVMNRTVPYQELLQYLTNNHTWKGWRFSPPAFLTVMLPRPAVIFGVTILDYDIFSVMRNVKREKTVLIYGQVKVHNNPEKLGSFVFKNESMSETFILTVPSPKKFSFVIVLFSSSNNEDQSGSEHRIEGLMIHGSF